MSLEITELRLLIEWTDDPDSESYWYYRPRPPLEADGSSYSGEQDFVEEPARLTTRWCAHVRYKNGGSEGWIRGYGQTSQSAYDSAIASISAKALVNDPGPDY